MLKTQITLFIHCFLCAIIIFPVSAIAESEPEPWTLRDHYNFNGNGVTFQLDPKRSEWRVVADQADATVKAAYTEIELGDGTRIRLSKSNWITDGRDNFTDAFGNGLRFRSEFKPMDGLHVECHLNRYTSQAFMTYMIILRNTGTKPISIKAIRQAVVESGALASVRNEDIVVNRSRRRGVHTVLQSQDHVNLTGLRINGTPQLFGLGLLQSGYMRSSINLVQENANLSGAIESVFSPPIQMMPGGTAQSDPLWILLSAPDVESIHAAHSYSEGFVLTHSGQTNYPNGWMTVSDETSSDDLVLATTEWKSRSIHHALVPGGWQTGQENITVTMSQLAKSILDAGMKPGLTVDPLRSARAIPGVTIEAADGSHWLDISKPEARSYGSESLRELVSWKYEFFAVTPTEIPDAILSTMNITRSVADRVAFELLFAAAAGRPVMPTPALTLTDDANAWQAVARATEANLKNNILTGPLRLDVRGMTELSPSVSNALTRFPGPVEIIGTPNRKIRRQIAESVPTNDDE